MTTLPTRLAITSSATTNAEQKVNLGDQRDFLADMLGTDSSDKAAARVALGIRPEGTVVMNNGSMAVHQTGIFPTTDNAYGLDGYRLLLGAANAAVWTRDTADVPVGAGYASVLTVGSGSNNKFGLFVPIENRDMLFLRGDAMSLRVPLKATAGLVDGTGKIRIGVLQFTGTADAITGDPISAWNAEGTLPTLAAGWAFANTPAALPVTTSWADYLIENVSISASATNIAYLIWSDDTTNTTTTDRLRIGGYITGARGTTAPSAQISSYADELAKAKRYLQVYNAASGNTEPVCPGTGNSTTAGLFEYQFDVEPRIPPTGLAVSSVAHFSQRTPVGGAEVLTGITFVRANRRSAIATTATAGNLGVGVSASLVSGNASAQLIFTGAQL